MSQFKENRGGRLPPVGTVCEQQTWVNREWRKVTVVAHFNGFAVCAWEESPGYSQVELAPSGDLRLFEEVQHLPSSSLKQALETLILFTKPTKGNAAALNNAHQVLAELGGRS